MRALEFETRFAAEAQLRVPDEIAAQIPKGESIRVIVLIPESTEEADWSRLAAEQFLRGFGDSDSIYDAL
jgi:hypothetical protein